MATALDVAFEFIRLAALQDEPDYLTHMRLQKLVYYAQGWYLGIHGKPLFPDKIQAWAHGPVVRSIYDRFSDFHSKPIVLNRTPDSRGLSTCERQFVAEVWNAYKGHSAWSLSEMTHKEPPWRKARNGLDAATRSDREIPQSEMQRFFSQPSR